MSLNAGKERATPQILRRLPAVVRRPIERLQRYPFTLCLPPNRSAADDDALLSWPRVGAFVAAIQRSVILGGPCSRLDRRHATGVDGDRAALGRIIGVQARRPGGGTGTGGRRIVAFLG